MGQKRLSLIGIHLPNNAQKAINRSIAVSDVGCFTIKDSDPATNQEYHNIIALLRAITVLSSQKEVDASRIGVSGSSWGGFYTFYLASVDPRIKAAAPIYGCGNMKGTWWLDFPVDNKNIKEEWCKIIDPINYYKDIKCPIFFRRRPTTGHTGSIRQFRHILKSEAKNVLHCHLMRATAWNPQCRHHRKNGLTFILKEKVLFFHQSVR
jgi:hypothetical protein